MGTAAAIGIGLQLLADALGVVQQLNEGTLTDAQALQLYQSACANVQTAIDGFNAQVAKAQGTAPAPASPPSPTAAPPPAGPATS